MNAKPDKPEEARGAETAARPEATARAPEAASGRQSAKGGGEAAAKGGERVAIGRRPTQYLVAPQERGVSAESLSRRLSGVDGAEVIKLVTPRGTAGSPVAVVRMGPAQAAMLHRSTRGNWIIEPDEMLQSFSFAATTSAAVDVPRPASVAGPGFTATVQVLGENEQPLERAEVQVIGRQGTAQGATDGEGRLTLTLVGETPESVQALLVKPQSSHWALWQRDPQLQPQGVNVITLRALDITQTTWGAEAMGFHRLPAEYRGKGVKIAVVDSGVAVSHKQLGDVRHGLDASGQETWNQDAGGHGTACAGIIAAEPENGIGIRGFAPEAELHVYKLPVAAHCSDLLGALDYCIDNGIDVACIGLGCENGSAIVERQIAVAREQGVATVAGTGNDGSSVQFPACSPHVMAVGALGRVGAVPAEDSPSAAYVTSANTEGLFVAAFSCGGPEVDLSAPGVGVISCQAPDGYSVFDGTSFAACHVAALAGLVLAHHRDFHRSFAGHNVKRVERLFQILKQTAEPLGEPQSTGAGLAEVQRALGFPRQQAHLAAASVQAGLEELRGALRQAGLEQEGETLAGMPEPSRGPAIVSHLPFDGEGLSTIPEIGVGGGSLHELQSAMASAGLASIH